MALGGRVTVDKGPWRWRPRRRFGQHFLRSTGILSQIAEKAGIGPEDFVVEVGAGLGDLTRILASRAKEVLALEIDRGLVERLREIFRNSPNVRVLETDVLRWPLPESLRELPRPRKVVGNLPYNVASQILLRFAEFPQEVDCMAFMFQKEVAQRITASPNTEAYGSLSVILALHWEAHLAMKVGAGAFYPKPKVESALVTLTPLPEARYQVGDEVLFRSVVRAAFSNRRKTLWNALRVLDWAQRDVLERILERAKIDPRRRAESLSVQEFARISREATDVIGGRGGVGSIA